MKTIAHKAENNFTPAPFLRRNSSPSTRQITSVTDINAYTTPDGAGDVIYAGADNDFVAWWTG